jgi:hypothetical protein
MTTFQARKQLAQAIAGSYPCMSWDHVATLGPGAPGGENGI